MNDIKFAENIRKFRLNRGLTMEELGHKLGKAKSSISAWENGKRTPKMGEVQKIADFFGVSKSQLLGIDENKEHELNSINRDQTKIILPSLKNGETLSILGVPVLTDSPDIFYEHRESIEEILITNIDIVMKNSRDNLRNYLKKELEKKKVSESELETIVNRKMSEMPVDEQKEIAQSLVEKLTLEQNSINIYWNF